MPKSLFEYEYHALFLPWLCVATENIWGGECEEAAFLNSLQAHIRYSRQATDVRRAQFRLGFSALMQYGVHTLNCHIEKG